MVPYVSRKFIPRVLSTSILLICLACLFFWWGRGLHLTLSGIDHGWILLTGIIPRSCNWSPSSLCYSEEEGLITRMFWCLFVPALGMQTDILQYQSVCRKLRRRSGIQLEIINVKPCRYRKAKRQSRSKQESLSSTLMLSWYWIPLFLSSIQLDLSTNFQYRLPTQTPSSTRSIRNGSWLILLHCAVKIARPGEQSKSRKS